MEACCAPQVHDEVDRCPQCGGKGKPIGLVTIESLLTEAALARLEATHAFRFCRTPHCAVVYFSDDGLHLFMKSDVSVRVGQKEAFGPIPLCYCFGHTEESIAQEIVETGKSTVVASITAKVKAGECDCERRNPQGGCCLGNVNLAVKKAQSLLSTK